MNKEKYIVTDEELALLERYDGILRQTKDPYRFDSFDKDSLISSLVMSERTSDIFEKRYAAAKDVIDMIASHVGIDPDSCGFWLYAPDADGSSPILRRIEEWFSRSGEKAKIKRRLQELEEENAFLKSLIHVKK